jgi:sporulation protein YlmC with PRC-barrel domain
MDDDRLSGALDAVLHLLDRQVVDVEGRMVCKVDDVELAEADGSIWVTGLLSGAAARMPRYGDRRSGRVLHDFWRRLGAEHADRDDPMRIDLALVARLGSGVELDVRREGLLLPQGERRRSLNDLLQLQVQGPDGVDRGRVLDVRLENDSRPERRLRVTGLVIGRGRPGSYLGYDRRADMGPWLLNKIIRRWHRRSAYVAITDLDELDWRAGVIRVDPERFRDLEPA